MFLKLEKLQRVSKIAKIHIQELEKELLLKTVNNEFSHLDIVSEIDTTNVKPMVNPNDSEQLEQHVDEVLDGDNAGELMECAPNSLYNYFAVPKVIKQGEEQ
jgi:aspartyl-tRNA(Asn)/glutamyl-tRNA(Gln) amidotransferase subunit C